MSKAKTEHEHNKATHTHTSKKPTRRRHVEKLGHWPVVILIGLFVLASVLSLKATYRLSYTLMHPTYRAPTQRPVADQSKYLNSVQPVERGAYRLELESVTENPKPDPAFAPDPTFSTLILNVKLTNKSASQQYLVPATQFYVRTREGDVYPLHMSMYVKKQLPAGVVEPGQTVTGQLSFIIPKSLTNPLVYADLGWDNSTPAVIDVLK